MSAPRTTPPSNDILFEPRSPPLMALNSLFCCEQLRIISPLLTRASILSPDVPPPPTMPPFANFGNWLIRASTEVIAAATAIILNGKGNDSAALFPTAEAASEVLPATSRAFALAFVDEAD